jgi:amidohydrolase
MSTRIPALQELPATGGSPDIAAGWLTAHGAGLIELRRHLHAHPELANAEHATTALVLERLRNAGLSPTALPGTGVVCDLGDPAAGPTIALRADLDALPIPDTKDVPYRSTVAGVAHACGHDVHTTTLLGAGLALAEHAARNPLPGRIRLLFQPAEETMPGGAHALVEAGLVDDVELVLALHCDPTLTVGQVGLRPGPITAAADRLVVRLTGPGGHTSRPDRTVDLVGALAAIASQAPLALARRMDARSATTLVWGSVHAGQTANAIPSHGELVGTVRTLDHESWARLPEVLPDVVSAVAAGWGAEVEVVHIVGVPPVVNDERAVAILSRAAETVLGPDAGVPTKQSLGGEDFAWYLERTRGAMVRLGTRPVSWTGPDLDLHQGAFDVDERAIDVGVRLLARAAVDALAEG